MRVSVPKQPPFPKCTTRLEQATACRFHDALAATRDGLKNEPPSWYRWIKVWQRAIRALDPSDVGRCGRDLLGPLADRADNTTGYCGQVPHAALAREIGASVDTVGRGIADLEKAGALVRSSSGQEGAAWHIWLIDDVMLKLPNRPHPAEGARQRAGTPPQRARPPGQDAEGAPQGADQYFSSARSSGSSPSSRERARTPATAITTVAEFDEVWSGRRRGPHRNDSRWRQPLSREEGHKRLIKRFDLLPSNFSPDHWDALVSAACLYGVEDLVVERARVELRGAA